jgi:hypothetical protein
MSKVAIKGADTGTGVFTLESPATNTDRTLVLPDEAGTVLTSASTIAASQITNALNATGSAPIYACRAWVNFDGTGTVSIRASGNVSSITDNETGNYTVNFTTAMPDTNYSVVSGDFFYGAGWDDTYTTTSVKTRRINLSGTYTDVGLINIIVFR